MSYKHGCPDCDWWDESSHPDFGVCALCKQPKTVWNMTDAEAETDYELMIEEQCAAIASAEKGAGQ
jgi:hypothetical protein